MATIAQSGALSILKFDDTTGALVMQSQIHQSNPAVEQDLHQWKDAAGNVLASIAYKPSQGYTAYLKLYDTVYTPGFPYGTYFKATYASINTFGTKVYFDGNTSGVPVSWAFRDNGFNEGLTITDHGRTLTTNSQYTGGLTVLSSNATYVPLTIKGAASQTGNLLEFQNSAGTVLTRVNSGGDLLIPDSRMALGSTSVLTNTFLFANTPYPSYTPIVVRGASSQTANLTEWQNSSGSVKSYVDSNGVFTAGAGRVVLYNNYSASYFADGINSDGNYNSGGTVRGSSGGIFGGPTQLSSAGLTVYATAAGNPGAIIRGAASQTAKLQEWQTSAGTIIGGANALAQTYTGSTDTITVATGGATTAASGDGTTATITTTSAHGLAVGDLVTVAGVTPTGYNGTYLITAVTSTTISYANATTGAQTVAGTVSAPAQSSITARSAGTAGLVIKLAASQSSDALTVQNSSGIGIARITNNGLLYGSGLFARYLYTGALTGAYFDTITVSNTFSLIQQVTTAVNLIVKGVASQTADLQQWQNSSGTILASMSASGSFSAVTKSFVIKHPTKEGKLLRYGSLEGPENGIYIRGKIDGGNVIDLPEYWTALVDESTITVNITPIGSDQNLYIEDIKDNKVYVSGSINAKFFYTIFAERKDVEKLVVEE